MVSPRTSMTATCAWSIRVACDSGNAPGQRLLLEPPAALNALAQQLLPNARPVRVIAFNKSEDQQLDAPLAPGSRRCAPRARRNARLHQLDQQSRHLARRAADRTAGAYALRPHPSRSGRHRKRLPPTRARDARTARSLRGARRAAPLPARHEQPLDVGHDVRLAALHAALRVAPGRVPPARRAARS